MAKSALKFALKNKKNTYYIYWFSCDFPVNFLWPQKPFWTPKRWLFGLVELVRKRFENSRLKLCDFRVSKFFTWYWMPQKPCINGYYFCVVKMEELFAIAVSFGKIVRNRGFSLIIWYHPDEKKTDPAHFVLPLFCEKAL